MIRQFNDMDSMAEWRYVGLIQLLIFIVDIPVMVALIILTLTIWRMCPLVKELKEEGCEFDFQSKTWDIYYSGCEERGIILKHFFLLFVDILFVPAGVLCFFSWRCFIFVRKMKDADNDWKRRKVCFIQLFQLFLDIPCIILFIFCFFTWRMPFLIKSIREEFKDSPEWDDIRWISFYEFGLFIVDIPCVICFIFTFITWRNPFMFAELLKRNVFKKQWKYRKIVCLQALLVFVDIPCILCALFILVSLWRFPMLVVAIRKAMSEKSDRQWYLRIATVKEAGMFFVDVFCFIMMLILFVSFWRAYPLCRDIKKYINRKTEKSKTDEKKDEDLPTTDPVQDEAKVTVDASHDSQVENDQASDTSHSDEALMGGKQSSFKTSSDRDNGVTIVNVPDPDSGLTETSLEMSNQLSDNSQLEDTPPAKTYSNIGWKIRKAICKHFVFLLIDIPAFACLALLIVTLLKLPKVFSTLIQSGDFYLEFAVTIYYQTLKLLIDFVFFVLFLVLMICRPIDSWIHLLEDEEHMKYRLLCHYMQWVPDIVARRRKVYNELDEIISVSLKSYDICSRVREKLSPVMDGFLEKLLWVHKNVKENELDPDYEHLLDLVIWYENKRIKKYMRKYQCELNFLMRPDVNLHKDNLFKLQQEFLQFDSNVDQQYAALQKFAPTKVPLWLDRTGLSTRTRKETQTVLIKCLPRGNFALAVLTLLCCVPLYRAPGLLIRIFRKFYDRANIILNTVKEYALDFLAILRILLVIVFIYRAPALLTELSIDIFEKRSWKAARKTAKRYPPLILMDFVLLIKTLLSWKTPRFIFTTTLFGLLMPADLFLTATKLCTKSKPASYFISAILYVIFVSFPFVLSFYLGRKLLQIGYGWVNVPLLCVFVVILLFMLALMLAGFVKEGEGQFSNQPKIADYLHFNWYNAHVVIFEILEFFQLMALSFSLPDVPPMYGGGVLHRASEYLLLSFISFDFKFWCVFSLFWIWFFLSGAPVIFEQILEDLPKGYCAKRMGWRMAMSLFANTLFVTITESLSSCVSCKYTRCPAGISYKNLATNSTCFSSNLLENPSYHCWTGSHRLISLFGMFALVWYTTTSLIFGAQYGDPDTRKQDIDFAPVYNVTMNFIKAIMVTCAVIITTNHTAVLGILIAANLFSLLFTVLFRVIFKYDPTNSRSFLVFRMASFVGGILSAVAVIVAYAIKKPDSNIPVYILGVGVSIVLFVALIAAVYLRKRTTVIEAREKFRKGLFELEKKLYEKKYLLSSWQKQQKGWRRLLRGVREARKDDHFYVAQQWESIPLPSVSPTENDDARDKAGPSSDKVDTTTTVSTLIAPVSPDRETSTNGPGTASASVAITEDIPPPPSYGAIDSADVSLAQSSIAQEEKDASLVPPPPGYSVAKTSIAPPLEELVLPPFSEPLLMMERSGVNLLLVLEHSITYQTYAYSFLATRAAWLSAVKQSNWTGLLHCLAVLEGNLDSSFSRPSKLDIALGGKSVPSDTLEDDSADQLEPPKYIAEPRDPAAIEAKSCAERQKALEDVLQIAEHGEHLKELLNKVLPTKPVIKEWKYDGDINGGNFEIRTRRPVCGTIKDVGPLGIKLAKGASFSLSKITKGRATTTGIHFSEGFQPKAKKGPIQLTVKELNFLWKKGCWYLESEGKSVKYDVAVDTMKEIEWR